MAEPVLTLVTARAGALPAEPPAPPDAPHVVPAAPERQDPPERRSEGLHVLLVGPGPDSPDPSPRRRWVLVLLPLVVVAAVLADGAGWFQPRQTPEVVAPGLTSPPATVEHPAPAASRVQPVPVSPVPALEPVAITPDPTAATLMRQALKLEAKAPAQAALAYARAALRGRARAAWYLGQLYETGTGVQADPGLARLWYAAAADLPAAQRRLRAMPAPGASPATPAEPKPVFQARLDSGGSEMIWRVPEGVTPVRFRVEMTGPGEKPLPARETAVPGLIVPFPVSTWRVIAIGAFGTESPPSATARMIPAGE